MDIKVGGITMDIMRKALEQARHGRLEILDKMAAALAAPRAEISAFAPRIVTIRIPTEKIRDVIGPGGKTIRSIIEKTGVKIDVEDDGRVNVASADEGAAKKAIAMIQELTATPEVDKSYKAASSASRTSARSSRSCPAWTDCSTSPKSPTIA